MSPNGLLIFMFGFLVGCLSGFVIKVAIDVFLIRKKNKNIEEVLPICNPQEAITIRLTPHPDESGYHCFIHGCDVTSPHVARVLSKCLHSLAMDFERKHVKNFKPEIVK